MEEKKYKVTFSGYVYITASSPEEAEEKFHDDDFAFKETSVDTTEEVDEFTVLI